jgi:hypothetical protein
MINKFKLYYFFSTIISLCVIIVSIINMKEIIQNYLLSQDSNEGKLCYPFYLWKISLFFNIFFFFASFGFLGYLCYRRKMNYNKIIYMKLGPIIDRTILIFLCFTSIILGPVMIAEIIMTLVYNQEIQNECSLNSEDNSISFFIPYVIISIIISIMMSFIMGLILYKRCSRRRIMRRSNILNIRRLINII